MIHKRILMANRVRRPPRAGFSWVDRRFVHVWIPKLSTDAILLYLFLATVADKNGLSYYRDDSIACRLRLRLAHVLEARDELLRLDLIAHDPPLTQVLSLPDGRRRTPTGLYALGELFEQARRSPVEE
jgi:hypothetical protein